MRLFDETTPSSDAPRQWSESAYAHLARSSRSEASAIRSLLEDWFSRYPDDRKSELRKRFSSVNDHEHYSASFELFLHELLCRCGYRVKVEAYLPNTPKRPDFFVSHGAGAPFYLEARVATDESKAAQGARAREAEVYNMIDQIDSPDFELKIEFEGAPTSPPRAAQIRNELANLIKSLDYEKLSIAYQTTQLRDLPRWRYHQDGWKLTFTPIPRGRTRGQPGQRTVAVPLPHYGVRGTSHEAMRTVLKKKVSRYGPLGLPYIIAVDSLSAWGFRGDAADALYGAESVTLHQLPDGSLQQTFARKQNGFWREARGAQNTRVSAVLIARNLEPWTIRSAELCLYHNPAPKHATQAFPRVTQAILGAAGRIEYQPGSSITKLLGVPSTWPTR